MRGRAGKGALREQGTNVLLQLDGCFASVPASALADEKLGRGQQDSVKSEAARVMVVR